MSDRTSARVTAGRSRGWRAAPLRRWSLLIALLCARRSFRPSCFWPIRACMSSMPSGGFGAFTFGHFAAIFTSRTFGPMILNSAVYSLGSALLALVIGAAQAWLAERTDAPLRQVLYVASIISLGIPYVLYIVAWLLFLGKAGPVNALLATDCSAARPVHQHLFARRHDLRRGHAVVAARLPAAVAGVPQFRCLVRGGGRASAAPACSRRCATSPSAWRGRRCWRSACWSSSRHRSRSRCRRWLVCRARPAS